MADHTEAWNELSPAGSDLASSIDNFMRNMKRDVRERLALQHYWASDTDESQSDFDGIHKEIKITPTAPNIPLLSMTSGQTINVTGANSTRGIDLDFNWNTTGAPVCLQLDIADVASDIESYHIVLNLAGNPRFAIRKDGEIRFGTNNLNNTWGCIDAFTLNVPTNYKGVSIASNAASMGNISSGPTRGVQIDNTKDSWAIDIGGVYGGDGAPWIPDAFNVVRRAAAGNWTSLFSITNTGAVVATSLTLSGPLVIGSGGLVITGTVAVTGSVTVTQVVTQAGVISPATLAAGNNNDYNPAGLSTAQLLRLSPDLGSGSTLTGLAAQAAGSIRILCNIRTPGISQIITVVCESPNSAAANRIVFGSVAGSSFDLNGGDSVSLVYDGVSSRWRVTGAPS